MGSNNKVHTSSSWMISFLFVLVLSGCDDESTPESVVQPTINSVSPNEAPPGATVTIAGANFNTTPANNQVSFNGALATVSSATSTKLILIVPDDASTGKISVTVDGQTATTIEDFVVISSVPFNGLVIYLPFNGNAEDESGNHHSTAVFGAALQEDRFGTENRCYYFDGQDDYISVANSALLEISPSMTVIAWVKLKPQVFTMVLSKFGDYSGNVSKGYSLILKQGANSVYSHGLLLKGAPINQLVVSGGEWHADEWVFIAVSTDSGVAKIYVNDKIGSAISGSQNLASTETEEGDLLIGRALGSGVGDPFNGWVDELAIYNRALTDDEVRNFYLVTKAN